MEGAGYRSHEAYQKMQDAGIERKQADAIVSALLQFQGELATKTDLRHWAQRLNDKIDGVEKGLDSKIDDVAKDLHSKIDGVEKDLQHEIKGLHSKIDGVEKRLDSKIDTVGLKLLLSLGSFMMVLTGLIISAVKGWI